jgi:hypothetical protein
MEIEKNSFMDLFPFPSIYTRERETKEKEKEKYDEGRKILPNCPCIYIV